jgi:hypothetical protein
VAGFQRYVPRQARSAALAGIRVTDDYDAIVGVGRAIDKVNVRLA